MHGRRFAPSARLLHWTMAVLLLAMLFIGVGMAATVSARYAWLVAMHKPLGIIILILAAIRVLNRRINPPPALPATLPAWQRQAARASHQLLYALMLLLPIVGWAMLSAARYPVVLYGTVYLPPIAPQSALLHALLRQVHTFLAYLLFATFLGHFGAALLHGLIRRDGVFESMAAWRR